jgi:hypothetical protein
MSNQTMHDYLISNLITCADRMDAVGIDGSDQPRNAAESLRTGKLSANRAMSLLCRVNCDLDMAGHGVL